jgi:glycosyltransferase involved in cell wall biosynthesis
LLSPVVREQCRFLLTGKLWNANRGFWGAIEGLIIEFSEIEYLGSFDHKSQLRAMADSDVLVCCSRDDPCPLVVIEAAILSKPAILSDHVGAAGRSTKRRPCGPIREH